MFKVLYSLYAQQDYFERWHPKECGGGVVSSDLAQKLNFQTIQTYLRWDWEKGGQKIRFILQCLNQNKNQTDSSSAYSSCLYLVQYRHLSKAPLYSEGRWLQPGIINGSWVFPESLLHPTSELSLHSPPLPLHTITSSKTAKLITCKCVLSVVLGVFCIPPKRYLHIEFKSLVFRASQINGVRHKPSYAPCFPQPNLIPLKDNSVPSLSL